MADNDPTPTPPVQVQPGPWQADIQATFSNPEEAARVDQFLRSRVQPRVTQLEQQLAATRDAQELYDAFHADPEGTFRAVQAQLVDLGYDVGTARQMAADAATAAATTPPPAQVAAQQTEDPRIAEMYADFTQARELAAYDAAVEAIVNDPANADVDPNLLHPFIAAADGDFNQGLVLYRNGIAQILQRFGIDPTTATPVQTAQAAELAAGEQGSANGAPPVMGAGAGGAGAAPPTQPDYRGSDGLHRAIEDATAAMLRKGSAPPVS